MEVLSFLVSAVFSAELSRHLPLAREGPFPRPRCQRPEKPLQKVDLPLRPCYAGFIYMGRAASGPRRIARCCILESIWGPPPSSCC